MTPPEWVSLFLFPAATTSQCQVAQAGDRNCEQEEFQRTGATVWRDAEQRFNEVHGVLSLGRAQVSPPVVSLLAVADAVNVGHRETGQIDAGRLALVRSGIREAHCFVAGASSTPMKRLSSEPPAVLGLHVLKAGAGSRIAIALLALVTMSAFAQQPALDAAAFRADAEALAELVNHRYAYLDRFKGGRFVLTPQLADEAATAHDRDSLLRFVERAMALLFDHHAITGEAHDDSWALVPSYSDLWVMEDAAGYVVSDVRSGMPAERHIQPGARILAVDGVAIEAAIDAWWRDLGVVAPGKEEREFAARVLLAGRRDRERLLTFRHGAKPPVTVRLPGVYSARRASGPQSPVAAERAAGVTRIVLQDSLGDASTISAFDAAMAAVPAGDAVVIDLTDTASGGTSTVARAIMGWFVTGPRPYQMHASPQEARDTGIARQWAEYVGPRAGKHFSGRVSVRVGRWTGSMGEGLAVGFAALGVPVCGTAMAGLLGAVEDSRLEHSGLIVKFPTERLATIGGTPREGFRPRPLQSAACASAAWADSTARPSPKSR